MDGVGDGARRRDDGHLADAAHAKGAAGRGILNADRFDIRRFWAGGHAVIQVAPVEQAPLLIVVERCIERLADALAVSGSTSTSVMCVAKAGPTTSALTAALTTTATSSLSIEHEYTNACLPNKVKRPRGSVTQGFDI